MIPTPAAGTETRVHVHGYYRRVAAASLRWLHIYVSMFSFAVLLFFAVTGLTLNHPDWFSRGAARTVQLQGTLDRSWVDGARGKDVGRLEVVEFLRATHGLKGVAEDFRVEESECSVSFKGPGYAADVFVDRETGSYRLTETRQGLIALLNDLHKGRDTGRTWSLVIDVSAVLLGVVSLTGLALLGFVRRRRFYGFVWVAVGAVGIVVIYALGVP